MSRFFLILLSLILFQISSSAKLLEDSIVVETLKNKEFNKPTTNLEYNYQSIERIPVKLYIVETLSTKRNGIYDGKELLFKVKEDIRYNRKVIIKKNTPVKARVASYTTRGFNGIPASIVIENFNIPGIDSNKMITSYTKYGINFMAFVLPLKWALTPFPPLGSFTNFIIGTNAKITPNNIITLYYYPHWGERQE